MMEGPICEDLPHFFRRSAWTFEPAESGLGVLYFDHGGTTPFERA